jgi:hypothetical protein
MNDDKATMPFEETESETSLRRIAEAARNREHCHEFLLKTKAAYSSAKEAYKAACEEERQTIDAETTELPLFPRPRAAPPQPAGPEPKGNGSPPPPGPAHSADPDAGTFLSSLKGFPMGALIALGQVSVQTVADLKGYLAEGGKLAEIEGLGEGVAAKILAALKRHEDSR